MLDDYTVALDATLANRAEALDMQLVERTRALDAAFSERLALFDNSMLRSAAAIDNAVNEKARALTVAMENHVRALSDTLGRQVSNIDHSMMSGIDAVRRTSDGITRQSFKAIEGLSNQTDVLRGVSETLMTPDLRRHQPVRQPRPIDRDCRQCVGGGNSPHRHDLAKAPGGTQRDPAAHVGQGAAAR